MKKVILPLLLVVATLGAHAQQSLFLQMLENRKMCNMEDQFTWFLQTNGFLRANENTYTRQYAEAGQFFTTTVLNPDPCYVIYRTDNPKDYNRIMKTITSDCRKELSRNKSECYICDTKRMHAVQVIFAGAAQISGQYEIMVYQNPGIHEEQYHNPQSTK